MKDKLLQFIKEKNMTKRQLANVLGVREETLYRWLSGQQKIGKMSTELIKLKLFIS